MFKMAYIIVRITWRLGVDSRQRKRHCKVESASLQMQTLFDPTHRRPLSLIFLRLPMNHVLPNPLKHPKVTFGVLRICLRHCPGKIPIRHIVEVNSVTLLSHISLP